MIEFPFADERVSKQRRLLSLITSSFSNDYLARDELAIKMAQHRQTNKRNRTDRRS